MLFSELVDTYERLDAISGRLEMTDILAQFFRTADKGSLRKAVYLTQGQLYPDFNPQKLGMADKLLFRTLSFATGQKESVIQEAMIREGDPGLVALQFLKGKRQSKLFPEPLTLDRVYAALEKIALSEGGGSQDTKMKILAEILVDSTPEEAKYISRIVSGKMRLGVANMTIIDALSIAFATKEERDIVENAFNVSSDIGLVADVIQEKGIAGVREIHVQVGNPMRAMLAERLPSPREILEKMSGTAAFEYKYDGVRVQAHVDGGKVSLYSRRLDLLTDQFPDVVKALKESFKGRSAIMEGECVPIDINTGEFLPFQEVSHRRGRKHGLEEAIEEYPVRLCLFDCLFLDGEDITQQPLLKRRASLQSCIQTSEAVKLSEMRVLSDEDAVEKFFTEALKDGCEGLMAKSISPDSVYRAGSRGFLWIKYKKEYRSEMTDTVDLVAIGGFAGRGKRKGFYGALLMATYDQESDTFETVSKLGSGFDDAMLASLMTLLEPYKLTDRNAKVKSNMVADFWFEPHLVLEVLGAEITLSPIHTCAFGKVKKDAGLAIRFPRYTGKIRDDKGPRDSTTSAELENMYRSQLKKIED